MTPSPRWVVREHGPNPWSNPVMLHMLAEAVLVSIRRHQDQAQPIVLETVRAVSKEAATCMPS
jgi:hypothetical protein